ncbi:hypothetical protein M3I54_29760 [Paraburkholderia sp. CNPSo 3274]|uniref:hypothetical protein n=1 Tax=Paraburkholderia sp. CNPSo 3274 TaxID=2940932 RepID=UPI0020B7D2F4|nr:hypothetical protein [Paraburkholderia sp. CNPSo 3274]MCP3711114.1 hypothetical protein [Paraburkholderia sp. CNPSo 3274]
MSDLSALDVPLLEYLGVSAIQNAVDTALGPGVVTISADAAGLSLDVDIGNGQSINLDNVSVSGNAPGAHLSIQGLSADKPLQATLLDGFTVALTAFDVVLANGGLQSTLVAGRFQIPFFTDDAGQPKSVDVELTTRPNGTLSITLAAATDAPTTADGLVQLEYSIGGGALVVELQVASLEFDQLPGNAWRILISGRLQLTTADLQWPGFELKGLGIDSHGDISIDGGWIDLPSQTALDFYGFHVGLERLGFGHDSSGRWIGFNGDIHLVEGLSLGGSVRGLRINIDTGALSFDGVAVDFLMPDVLHISGEIDHIHVDANSPDDLKQAGLLPTLLNNSAGQPTFPQKVDVFAGTVDVDIQAIPGDLSIQGRFIVGHFGGVSVFFLALDVELPVGIPVFADVSIYGFNGLFASNLEPHPEPDHTWWEWYKYPTDDTGVDVNATPDYDATAVEKWLSPRDGAIALGAGATIGTADDGFTASAAVSFVLMLPGPIIAIVGKANILSKRIGGANQDANFEALAVYDGNAGTFDLTIDAHYSIPDILDIDGTAQVHVGKSESPTWFLALGKPPHEKRFKARVLSLFETDAYLVVSDAGLVTGTWTGYRGSWSFGPLSVSLEAYLATIAAIQWSPLQIAAGVELRGDVHLDAFGIGLGISAEALLEATAPHPFWVHGDLSVELDLPWPLGSIGATVSLTWGGDDGSVPPSPLALNQINANVNDHTNSSGQPASDQYVLLAHRLGGPLPEPSLRYDDPAAPGILALDGPDSAAWHARVDGHDVSNPDSLLAMLPPLDPTGGGPDVFAPVVPQDTHFTLSFAHPVNDDAGFRNRVAAPDEIVKVDLPQTSPLIGKDDMSDLSFFQPAVQWQHDYSLAQVALYQYQAGAWQPVCSLPQGSSPAGDTRLDGVWLAAAAEGSSPKVQTRLKVVPYQISQGEVKVAAWGNASVGTTQGSDFVDQGIEFVLDAALGPATIGSVNQPGMLPGLMATRSQSSGTAVLHLRFPVPVMIVSIQALLFTNASAAPVWYADGSNSPFAFASETEDPATSQWKQSVADNPPPIQELTTNLDAGTLLLYSVVYRFPDVKQAILHDAPALYAIQTVTRISAGRVKDGGTVMQPVSTDPIVETAYLQIAAGPGGTSIDTTLPVVQPSPSVPPPYPQLSRNCIDARVPPNNTRSSQQPDAAFPLGGALSTLNSYVQWSWPPNGELAAYYGYDFNVEFVETYVNELYTALATSAADSLHFRCADRNQLRTLMQNVDTHLDSIPQMSALVAQPLTVQPPAMLAPSAPATQGGFTLASTQIGPSVLAALRERAGLASALPRIPAYIRSSEVASSIDTAQLVAQLGTRFGNSLVAQLEPSQAAGIIGLLDQQNDAQTAAALWFRSIEPLTRYALDVVAGPLYAADAQPGTAPAASLDAVFGAADPTSLLNALRAWQADDDARTPLVHIEFTTSRYATFADQIANVANQIKGTAGVPPLRYYTPGTDPLTWLADPSNKDGKRITDQGSYLDSRASLASIVASFDPLGDALSADASEAPYGAKALATARSDTNAAWDNFSASTNATFDALISALGRKDLAGTAQSPDVPDTELSLFRNTGSRLVALLLESPVPLPWRRIWRWINIGIGPEPFVALKSSAISAVAAVDRMARATISPVAGPGDGGLFGPTPPPAPTTYNVVLWNGDGTRGLIVLGETPQETSNFSIAFQGNIGAEAPCITRAGNAVSDAVSLGTLQIAAPIQ